MSTLFIPIRKLVRENNNVLNYLRIKSNVNNLNRDELIKLADNLGINWINELNNWLNPPNKKLNLNKSWNYLFEFDTGLEGVFEFDFKMMLLGMNIIKKVKCNYEFRPNWQYFCIIDKRLKYRWEGNVLAFEIQEIDYETVSENDYVVEKNKFWKKLDPDILDGSLMHRIERTIELKIWEEDQINRKQNGFPPGDKSKCWLFREN